MTLASNLLIGAFALAFVPAPTLAQTWPSIAVASTPALASSRPTTVPVSQSRRRTAPRAITLKIKARKPEPTQTVRGFEVRSKPEWFDDQGFRISPTRVAFKSRF